jgi:type I restriction enzyme S subunit
LKYGDLLFNTRNTPILVGKVAIWRNELSEAYYNSNLMKLEFDGHIVASNFFMNYLLNTDYLIEKLQSIATGTTSVAAIYTRDLFGLEISIPKGREQKAIAQILSDMDEELQTLRQKRDKMRRVKEGMMQELLTGKTRLV